MKQQLKRNLIGLLAVMLLLSLTSATVMAQGGSTAQVRFVHGIAGAAAIDVYTDSQLTISGLEYSAASTFATIPAGQHKLIVTQSGVTTPLWEQTINATAGSAQTLIASATNPPSFLGYQDDLTALPLGKARLTAVHTISGGPTVDVVLADGRPVIPGIEFSKPAGTLDLPTFNYDLLVVPSGKGADSALVKISAPLASGTSYVLVIYGAGSSAAATLLAAPSASQAGDGFLRVVHGAGDAADVDVFVNNALFAPSLKFGQATQHIAVPAGAHTVAVRAVGSDKDLATTSVTVESGKALTAVASGKTDSLKVTAFPDDISGVEATQARFSLINAISGDATVTATFKDGTAIGSDVAADKAGAAANVQPSKQAITLAIKSGSDAKSEEVPAQSFYGGVYYDVIAVADKDGKASLIVAPTSLAQGIKSAPGGATTTLVVAAPTEAATQAPPVAAAPTEAQPQAAQPTETVAAQPQEAATQPPAAATGPTGRVFNLDADRNLQLRQYPNSQALSLATVPPNTIVGVNGRIGGIEEIPNSATPKAPNGYQFVDPAKGLDPKTDLKPEETWLNITYTTPDGGLISAWANALYIEVRNAKGDKQRLADLPLVAANEPGEVKNTSVVPPPVPKDRVAASVFNLDAGVNLNIRRTPDTSGEVLGKVQNGTVMEFVGIKADRKWVFVRYTTPEGGVVTGWVNPLYIIYSLNSKNIKLDEIEQRKLLVITPDTERGTVEGGAPSVVVPTINPVKNAIVAVVAVDPGSNLNLRRTADVNSEVIAKIPSGTQLIVKERTGDGRWLNVTFESQTGWIAAKTDAGTFVNLTLNGKKIGLTDVPLAQGQNNVVTGTPAPATSAPNAQGAAPTPTLSNIQMIINDTLVQMTGSPGGNADGLPIVTKDQVVIQLFTDGKFTYIQIADGRRGWVPAGSLRPK